MYLSNGFSYFQYRRKYTESEPEHKHPGDQDSKRLYEAYEYGDGTVYFPSVLCREFLAHFIDGRSTFSGSDDLVEILREYREFRICLLDALGYLLSILHFSWDLFYLLMEYHIIAPFSREHESPDNGYACFQEQREGRGDTYDDVVAIDISDDRNPEIEPVEGTSSGHAFCISLKREDSYDHEDDDSPEIPLDKAARRYERLSCERELDSCIHEKGLQFRDDICHDGHNGPNQKEDDDERIGEGSFYLRFELFLVAELICETYKRMLHGTGLFPGLDNGYFSLVEDTRELFHGDAETIPGLHKDQQIQDLHFQLHVSAFIQKRTERRDNRHSSVHHICEVLVEQCFFLDTDPVPETHFRKLFDGIYTYFHEEEG